MIAVDVSCELLSFQGDRKERKREEKRREKLREMLDKKEKKHGATDKHEAKMTLLVCAKVQV